MGADGGTIPTRDELVRVKKKPEQKDRDAEIAARWKHCAISQQELRSPIVACELGRLYNKEAVLEYLLDKSISEVAHHINSLKDVKELILTENPSFVEGPESGGYVDRQTARYLCPVVGVEMNGLYRFCFPWSCGCVVSERAMKEVRTEACHKCGKAFANEDVVILNGNDEDISQLTTRMNERRLKAKLERRSKKAEKRKSESTPANGRKSESTPANGAIPSDGQPTAKKTKATADSKPVSKLAQSVASNNDKGKHNGKTRSVQEDPNASETYKSLFTSSKKAQNQPKAHWVTFNPFYNH